MRALGSSFVVVVVAACGAAQPAAPPVTAAPPAATGQLVETTTAEGDGVRVKIDGTDLPLAQLPLADWVGLPMTGSGAVHVDLHVPIVDGRRDLRGADGDIALACPTGCWLGNDHARIGAHTRDPRTAAFSGAGIDFGHIAFDHVAIAVHVAHGHAQITQWQVASADVDVDLAMQWQLGESYDDSLVSGCLRFAVKPALAKSQPKTAAVVETTGAQLGSDAHFHIRLSGRAGDMRRMAQDCTGNEPIVADEPAPPPQQPPPAADVPQDGGSDAGTAGVTKIDDHTFDVTRDAVDRVLQNPMSAAKDMRIVPAMTNGKPDGFKLYAIKPGSLIDRLGFKNGDTLREINGFALTSADKALEAYVKVRDATEILVTVGRAGQNVTLTYRIH
jgi:hypothetical protein